MTIAAVTVGFLTTAFAMSQGEFRPGTRFGVFSLVLALVLLVALFLSGINFTHLSLPSNS